MNHEKQYIPPGKPVKKRLVHEDSTIRVTHLLDEKGNIVAELHTDLTVDEKGGE